MQGYPRHFEVLAAGSPHGALTSQSSGRAGHAADFGR